MPLNPDLPRFHRADFKDNDRPIRDLFAQLVTDGLMGRLSGLGAADEKSDEEKRIDQLRERCRKGDPFPLIAAQWPELLITDPEEAKFFQGEIGNPDNPCLRLDDWQRDYVLKPLFDDTVFEIAIKGNTKAGKGCSVSIGINLWYDVWEDAKIILTSQSHDHAKDVIFGEVVKWREKMQHPGPGETLASSISHTTQHYIRVSNPKDGEGFSGQHGPHTLFALDEGTAIPDGRYDDATKQARKILALANPRTLFGWFRDLYRPCGDINKTQIVNGPFGRRQCVTIGGADCMNVRHRRLDRPISPPGGIDIDGRHYPAGEVIPPDAFARVKLLIPEQCDYGRYMGILQHPDRRHVDVFGHGRFPTEDPDKQIILGSWLERHEKAYREDALPEVVCFGLDVARSLDGDSTVLTAGGKTGLAKIYRWKYADTTYHTREVIRLVKEKHGIDLTAGRNPVCVDMDGLGVGVGDQLRALGVWVIDFRGNMPSTVDPRVYGNARAEAYGTLGRRLNPDDRWGHEPWALPVDEHLREELTAPEKIFGADVFRWIVNPKVKPSDSGSAVQSIKEKIGRSPDSADAVVYLFRAVREFYLMDELFRAYQGDLVVSGNVETVQPRGADTRREEEAAAAGDLFAWLAARYGAPGEAELAAALGGCVESTPPARPASVAQAVPPVVPPADDSRMSPRPADTDEDPFAAYLASFQETRETREAP